MSREAEPNDPDEILRSKLSSSRAAAPTKTKTRKEKQTQYEGTTNTVEHNDGLRPSMCCACFAKNKSKSDEPCTDRMEWTLLGIGLRLVIRFIRW